MLFFFGDGNVSVNENRDILKIFVRFKRVLLVNQRCNYFEYFNVYCYFLVALHPSKFCKIAPINFVMIIFTKHLEMHCFKWRRHKVGNNYVR